MNLNKLLTVLRQRKNTPARNLQAGRHERYTHALEQFLDGQPAVRLSGAYTLVNLADEWLTDASLPEQVRRDFTRDQEALREEQLVRRTVFMEFSRRLAAYHSCRETPLVSLKQANPSLMTRRSPWQLALPYAGR